MNYIAKIQSLPPKKNIRSGGLTNFLVKYGYHFYIGNSKNKSVVRVTFPTEEAYNNFIDIYNDLFGVI